MRSDRLFILCIDEKKLLKKLKLNGKLDLRKVKKVYQILVFTIHGKT